MPDRSAADDCERIRALVARSARLLDQGQFEGFVELFAARGTYSMEVYSAEIGHHMTWMALDRSELATLFKEYPQHIRDMATRTHLVSVGEIHAALDTATAISTFAVFRTDPHGLSTLYVVGSYEDDFVLDNGNWKLNRRRVQLDTRQLATPTPLPL